MSEPTLKEILGQKAKEAYEKFINKFIKDKKQT